MSQDQGEGQQQQPIPNLQTQAMIGEMRRIMRAEFERLHERIDRVEARSPRGQQPIAPNVHRREMKNAMRGRFIPDHYTTNDELQLRDGRRKSSQSIRLEQYTPPPHRRTEYSLPTPSRINQHRTVQTQIETRVRARDLRCHMCQGWGHLQDQCPNHHVLFIPEQEELKLASQREFDDRDGTRHTDQPLKSLPSTAIEDEKSMEVPETSKEDDEPQRLNNCGETKMSKQVWASFTIGEYKDPILCNVVPMTPKQVFEDPVKSKKENDNESNSRTNSFEQGGDDMIPRGANEIGKRLEEKLPKLWSSPQKLRRYIQYRVREKSGEEKPGNNKIMANSSFRSRSPSNRSRSSSVKRSFAVFRQILELPQPQPRLLARHSQGLLARHSQGLLARHSRDLLAQPQLGAAAPHASCRTSTPGVAAPALLAKQSQDLSLPHHTPTCRALPPGVAAAAAAPSRLELPLLNR